MLSSLKTASSPGQSARGSGGGGGSGPGSPGGGEPGGGSAGAALGYSGVERSVGSGSGPPGALSVTDDRQGQPVKVQVGAGGGGGSECGGVMCGESTPMPRSRASP